MRGLIAALRDGWRSLLRAGARPSLFDLSCACGHVNRGERGSRGRLLRCAGCGQPLFVLPRSPWPTAEPDNSPARKRRSPWVLPVTAGGLTLTAVVVGFLLWFNSFRDDRPPPPPHEPNKGLQGAVAVSEAREMIRRRHFAGAVKRLEEARERGEVHPELTPLLRQAALLNDLLTQPLEDLLTIAQAERTPEQWREKFREYRGKAVVFDDVVDVDPWGQLRLAGYEVRVNEERARVKLELSLFRQLPAGPERRVVFGARLSSVAREEGGVWVIRFDPESGVLLTEQGAAEACGLVPVDDGLRRILDEQARWVQKVP